MSQDVLATRVLLVLLLGCTLRLVSGQFGDEKPVIREGPSNVVASRGSRTELKCSVYGVPMPTVQWYKNSAVLDISDSRFSLVAGTLVIGRVKRSNRHSDEGVYYCVATNRAGQATSNNATLTVTYLSKRFLQLPVNVSTVLDGTARFTCRPPDGYPQAAVSWLLNGRVIPADIRFQRTIQGAFYELKIEPVKLSDAGMYICEASNTADRRQSGAAYLYIRAKPTAVILPQSLKVYERYPVSFACRVTGAPSPSVTWTKDGKKIVVGPRGRLTSATSLEFQSAELQDSGTYKCSATNREGTAESTASLTVLRRPEFITRPTHLSVGIGQTATLECEVKGEPGLTLFWQKLIGASFVETLIFPLQPYDGRLLVSSDGLLTISNVQKKDAAIYICTVHSGPITISASAKLTVLENSAPPPVVILTPGNTTVSEESNVTLECLAQGTPTPAVTWEYGASNLRISASSDGVTLTSNGTRHLLIFTNIQRRSSGSYRCIASNSGGTIAKLAYLDVKLLPKPPSPPDNVHVTNVTDSTLTLVWNAAVSAQSTPVTSYDIEFLNLDSRTTWQVLVKSVQALQFTVAGLMPDTRYRFSVRAINDVGESARSVPSMVTRTLTRPTSPPTLSPSSSVTTVDKLLDLKLDLSLFPYNRDSLQLSWKTVKPADRIRGFYLYWRQVGAARFQRLDLNGNHISSYILTNLQRDTAYEVKIQAFNRKYTSPMSDIMALKTTSHVAVFPPRQVRVAQGGKGQILVTWESPVVALPGANDIIGYTITCVSTTNTPAHVAMVERNITSYQISNLVPSKEYIVTVAARTAEGDGIASEKRVIKLAAAGGALPMTPGPVLPPGGGASHVQPSSFIRTVKSTWFIATVGGVMWFLLLFVVLLIVCRRRKRAKRAGRPSMFNEQAKSLLTGSKSLNGETNIMQSGLIYTDHSAFWSSTHGEEYNSLTGGSRSLKSSSKPAHFSNGHPADNSGQSYYTHNGPGEIYEMKGTDSFQPPKTNGPIQTDNSSLPLHKNSNAESWRDAAKKAPSDLLASTSGQKSRSNSTGTQERPRLKIQGAFDPSQTSGDEANRTAERRSNSNRVNEPAKQNTAERSAEIKRTRTMPKPDQLTVDGTAADSKPEEDSVAPGNDTLRRKMKSPFKPVPRLTTMNWADVMPGPPSKPPSSMGSPPDSPKLMSCNASAFSENVGRASRMSHGSNGSVHRYPYGGGGGGSRSHRAPSVSSRRLSQSSSMMSSELYQSEMDPSVHGDVYSERKKTRGKAVPPPIEMEGLTSDILLQWAESVTNSSPSSSGSSSPSRMSAVSSTGSFLNDEEFAQAVAAVAECGGFSMDMPEYSLGACGVPSLTKDRLTRLEQSKNKLDRIDAMIASQARLTRPGGGGGSLSNGSRPRGDHMASPSPVAPISLSNYLLGPNKRNGGSSVASGPTEGTAAAKHRGRSSSRHTSLDHGYGNFDSASSSSTPLTTSNLREHESSIDTTQQSTPPLTINNLKHHESSLERQNKHATPRANGTNGESRPRRSGRPSPSAGSLERTNGHSSPPPRLPSATNSADRQSKRKHFVNLMDPNSSTSTASTVRTTPEQTDC